VRAQEQLAAEALGSSEAAQAAVQHEVLMRAAAAADAQAAALGLSSGAGGADGALPALPARMACPFWFEETQAGCKAGLE
jgi:hypothetical protein